MKKKTHALPEVMKVGSIKNKWIRPRARRTEGGGAVPFHPYATELRTSSRPPTPDSRQDKNRGPPSCAGRPGGPGPLLLARVRNARHVLHHTSLSGCPCLSLAHSALASGHQHEWSRSASGPDIIACPPCIIQ